jgi:argininosuccinate lyase
MAWFEMLERDYARLTDCRARANVMPLGAAALSGTSYCLDRAYTAQLLGFDHPSNNSLDAVSDRDFAIEFCAAGSLVMTHLSRMAEEIVLWSSQQFGFISLPDRFCTGSSIMPQKKNPDVAELVRGKTGRVNGHLVALLTLMKAQPLAYNKDNQEDKEPLFDTADTLEACLRAFAEMMPAVEVNKQAMRAAAAEGFSTATDLADYLVRKGVPFRDAHELVGQVVRTALERKTPLNELPLDVLRALSPAIEQDVYHVLSLEGSLKSRNLLGGAAPTQARLQIQAARARLGLL